MNIGEELYLEPNRKAQVILLLVLLLLFMLTLLLPTSRDAMIDHFAPRQDAPLEEIISQTRVLLTLTISALLVIFAFFLASAAYFARRSYRILKLGSYPLPGSVVFFRTRVYTGKRAVLVGYLFIFLSALMVAHSFMTGYAIWLSITLALKV